MSLLIRRGLDADRTTITPSEGELIYTTDTKELYIGDGITVGGNPISTGGIETDPIYSASTWFSTINNSTDWNTAYSWGDHSLAGYLTSYSETDPIYSASSWFSTTNNSSNWNTAFGWGNHASAGYLTTISGLNISLLTNDSGYITASALSPYLTSTTAASTYQPLDADLTSIAALGFTSTAFLKKTAANTWTLDTNAYLTSISGLNISLLTNDSGYITSSALSPYLTSATAASTYFPLVGGSLTGTAGAGFFGAIAQSSNPSTPTSGFKLFANSSHAFSWIGQNGFIRTFDGTSNTADRTYTLPNNSGTFPLGTGTANELAYWSGTNTLGTLTTATYPSLIQLSYVKGVTSAIQTQLDAKDDKSTAAYTFHANNTNATANMTDQVFRKMAEATYSGTITWTGTTAPSGSTAHTYRWTQIGNLVTLIIYLDYSVGGTALTAVAITLPSDCPAPYEPTGTGAANDFISSNGTGLLLTSRSNGNRNICLLRVNSADTNWEIQLASSSSNYRYAQVQITYLAS